MDPLSPDLLRTLVAFAETGSLTRAAQTVNRTASAVTAQMQKLEELVGRPLFMAAGRGRVLTDAGEELVSHARSVLAAHRDLALAMQGAQAEGAVSLGMTQDFAGEPLQVLLAAFASTHRRLRFDLRVGRSVALMRDLEEGRIDVSLTLQVPSPLPVVTSFDEPMVWLGAVGTTFAPDAELPLALLDPPCGFRDAAIRSLDAAGRRYRIAATSPSLEGLRTAVGAGLALTVRTRRFAEGRIGPAPLGLLLPDLPRARFVLRCRPDAPPSAQTLAGLLADGLSR